MPCVEKDSFNPTWHSENVFAGTAWYYARYRPPYPDEVINLLVSKFRLTKDSRVLDLGCGTGQIALKLAPYVSQVIAVDPQEEMLREGESAAVAGNISNILWLKGESRQLSDMAGQIGGINLTVIARAFHWMDRKKTLADLYKITSPDGGVAVITDGGPTDGATFPWKEAIQQTVKEWLGSERKAGTQGTFSHPSRPFEDYMKASRFGNFEIAAFKLERSWTVDAIIGYMYSTSLCSLPVLGNKKGSFEADLRKRLLKIKPDGIFNEHVEISVRMLRKKIE